LFGPKPGKRVTCSFQLGGTGVSIVRLPACRSLDVTEILAGPNCHSLKGDFWDRIGKMLLCFGAWAVPFMYGDVGRT
jgi:hypothetical protein